jgi:hypothetical protein
MCALTNPDEDKNDAEDDAEAQRAAEDEELEDRERRALAWERELGVSEAETE